MDSYHEAFDGRAYRRWLDEVTNGRNIQQGSPLDPFQSSMRTVRALVTAMVRIDDGLPPVDRDVPQALGDLQRAGVVEAGRLNELGRAAVAQWRAHGVARYPGGTQRTRRRYVTSDILRSVLLLREAFSQGVLQYHAYLDRWHQLRQLYRPADLVRQDPAWLLYYFSYLDRTVDDFNPWRCVAGAPIALFSPADNEPGNDPQVRLERTIYEYATRGNRREFCAALECVTLRSGHDRERLLTDLANAGVMVTPGDGADDVAESD